MKKKTLKKHIKTLSRQLAETRQHNEILCTQLSTMATQVISAHGENRRTKQKLNQAQQKLGEMLMQQPSSS